MKIITFKMIQSWNPCYDPTKYIDESWTGTVLDVLKMEAVSHDDRLWVVLREELLSEKTLRDFALWCAEQCSEYVPENEQLCYLNILEIIRQCNAGEQDEEIRDAAKYAARNAAKYAVWDAAKYAVWTRAAAWYAARVAARHEPWNAARNAAWYASRAFAWAVAYNNDWSSAYNAAREAQINKLIEMLENE